MTMEAEIGARQEKKCQGAMATIRGQDEADDSIQSLRGSVALAIP